jgi:hypothetical protein
LPSTFDQKTSMAGNSFVRSISFCLSFGTLWVYEYHCWFDNFRIIKLIKAYHLFSNSSEIWRAGIRKHWDPYVCEATSLLLYNLYQVVFI